MAYSELPDKYTLIEYTSRREVSKACKLNMSWYLEPYQPNQGVQN